MLPQARRYRFPRQHLLFWSIHPIPLHWHCVSSDAKRLGYLGQNPPTRVTNVFQHRTAQSGPSDVLRLMIEVKSRVHLLAINSSKGGMESGVEEECQELVQVTVVVNGLGGTEPLLWCTNLVLSKLLKLLGQRGNSIRDMPEFAGVKDGRRRGLGPQGGPFTALTAGAEGLCATENAGFGTSHGDIYIFVMKSPFRHCFWL